MGWVADITERWIEETSSGERPCFVQVALKFKTSDGWSEPITGIGGSMQIAKESGGLYVNDECYKMAYTDAISVACKALGFAADIYWDADATKYSQTNGSILQCCVCGKMMEQSFFQRSIEANGKPYCSGTCKRKDAE